MKLGRFTHSITVTPEPEVPILYGCITHVRTEARESKASNSGGQINCIAFTFLVASKFSIQTSRAYFQETVIKDGEP